MTGDDGKNVDISQDVSWTAKFVDRISEVTDSMNVSGTSLAFSSVSDRIVDTYVSLRISSD